MNVDNPKQFEAANEFNRVLIAKVTSDKGVHVETAVSAIARMAGTFLLRASGLPVANMKPGTPVFSDVMNEQGPQLLRVVDQALASMGVAVDARKVVYNLPAEHDPHIDLMRTQVLLEGAFRAIAGKYGLTEEEAAGALAIATAVLIRKCSGKVDPHITYAVAAYGMVEGCKTVPADAVAASGG